jgi:hypothetical protein
MRTFAAGLLVVLSATPGLADQVTAIRRPDGSISIVQSRGRDTQVINSTGKPSFRVSDRPHDDVVRSLAPYGSQIAKQPR